MHLRYSQHILLSAVEADPKGQKLQLMNKQYFLSAHNLHNPEVCFLAKDSTPEIQIQFYQGFEDMIFQILPNFQYEVQSFLESVSPSDPKQHLYQKKLQIENEVNKSIIQSLRNKPVSVGDRIQLLHVNTQMYLEVSNKEAFVGQ